MKVFMKLMVLIILLFWRPIVLEAQAPEWEWAVSGTNLFSVVASIAVDNQGNQYVTGMFGGSTNFGTTELVSQGSFDVFVVKLDPSGNWLWAVSAGGTDYDYSNGIGLDSEGNVYLAGTFNGAAYFGTHSLYSVGNADAFVSKIDSSGNWIWAVRGGGFGEDKGDCMDVDSYGRVCLSGRYQGTAHFGAHTLSSVGTTGLYTARLDSSGNWLLATSAEGWAICYDIDLDPTGNAFLTGRFPDTVSFGQHTLTTGTAYDIFVAMQDSGGNWLWAVSAGGAQYDFGDAITCDSSGNAYLTGRYSSIGIFGPYSLVSFGSQDIFIAKVDSSGNWLWAVGAGSTYPAEGGTCIDLDPDDNPCLGGYYQKTAFFGADSLIAGIDTYIEGFAAKLDPNGTWLWATSTDTSDELQVFDLAVDTAGNTYLTGSYNDTTRFGRHILTGSGLFIAKLGSESPVSDDINPPIADNLTLSASPNPFQSSTKIALTRYNNGLSTSNATMSVYDIRGRRVKVLTNSSDTEHNTWSWDGTDEQGCRCPSGIYLIGLDLIESRTTLKIYLIR